MKINIFNWFKSKPKKVVKDLFIIEHYPLSNSYFVKYKDQYIKIWYSTGFPALEPKIIYAHSCKTLEAAEDLIKLYKEFHYKNNVKIIKSKHNE